MFELRMCGRSEVACTSTNFQRALSRNVNNSRKRDVFTRITRIMQARQTPVHCVRRKEINNKCDGSPNVLLL